MYRHASQSKACATHGRLRGLSKWGLSWSYDRYGNITPENQTYGAPPHFSVTVTASTNQIFGAPYTYDSGGNLLTDGNNTLKYDAENHVVSASNGGTSGTYTYDAPFASRMLSRDGNNVRVKKVSGANTTVTIYSGGVVLAEYLNGAAPGSPTNEYIYAGSQRIMSVQSGTTDYWHYDHLSPRVRTDTSGNVADQRGTYPFGENWYSPSGAGWMFTTYARDAESGNDYAMARSHVNRLNRFSSPDPLDLAAVSLDNPQSLNRYSYVMDVPVSLVDPLGLQPYRQQPVPEGPFSFLGNDTFDLIMLAFTPTGTTTIKDTSSDCVVELVCKPDVIVSVYGNIGLLALLAGGNTSGNDAGQGAAPCAEKAAYRITQGILGATNLTLAGAKVSALGAADTFLGGLAPETGGATAFAAAGITLYGGTSIVGQATSGTGQLYTAFSGDAKGGAGMSQVGDILSGPISGLYTLIKTGDPVKAQRYANIESTITAGAGLVGSRNVRDRIQSAVDTALGVLGLSGAGCHP